MPEKQLVPRQCLFEMNRLLPTSHFQMPDYLNISLILQKHVRNLITQPFTILIPQSIGNIRMIPPSISPVKAQI